VMRALIAGLHEYPLFGQNTIPSRDIRVRPLVWQYLSGRGTTQQIAYHKRRRRWPTKYALQAEEVASPASYPTYHNHCKRGFAYYSTVKNGLKPNELMRQTFSMHVQLNRQPHSGWPQRPKGSMPDFALFLRHQFIIWTPIVWTPPNNYVNHSFI
jgi:hypothetical protein